MDIIKIEPCRGHGGGGAMRIATFTIEIGGILRLHNLNLMETARGYRTYFPRINGGGNSASVDPAFAEEITAAAVAALEGHGSANDNQSDHAA